MNMIVSEVHCAVLQLLLQLRVLIPSVLPAARDQHAVAAKELRFHAYTGEGLDRRQLRRERADGHRERLRRTKRVFDI